MGKGAIISERGSHLRFDPVVLAPIGDKVDGKHRICDRRTVEIAAVSYGVEGADDGLTPGGPKSVESVGSTEFWRLSTVMPGIK